MGFCTYVFGSRGRGSGGIPSPPSGGVGFPPLGSGPLPRDSLPFLLGLRGFRLGSPDRYRLLQDDVEVGSSTGDLFSCSRPAASPAEENPSPP